MADAPQMLHPQTDVAASDIVSSGGFGDFNVRNSTECHLDGQVFARRVDAALYMAQKLGFRLADAAQYVRELPERDLPNHRLGHTEK